ncbi:beta-hydroxyacyl-ACP dehydratase [Micromonospora sp. NPDC047738]|uniref:3-hydroxyacyl-ACP dehydratase FabZ family protein n=1 Tax=unclassified Micromonospora TaxID=2617518 RepID=UPI0033CCD3A8
MNAAEIRAALPQRHPLLLVDRVTSLEPGVAIETVKAITATEPCYAHLDDDATAEDYAYPASLLIESFGQSAALLWLDGSAPSHRLTDDAVLLFVGARDYTVEGRAYPGDVVRHVVRLERVVADTAFATGESWAGERRIATVGSLIAARRPRAAVAEPAPGRTGTGADRTIPANTSAQGGRHVR